MQEFLRGYALIFDGVIDREEQATIVLMNGGVNRFFEDAITACENRPLGLIRLNRLGKQHKGHQRITLIIRPFIVIAIWRKENFHLAQKTALTREIEAKQRFLHIIGPVYRIACQPNSRRRPSPVIVDFVERLRLPL